MKKLEQHILDIWYKNKTGFLFYFLLPFSFIYKIIFAIRKILFSVLYKNRSLEVPVIVVGNITVGGTGKTPLVICIYNLLKENKKNPIVISRGYKGGKDFEYVTPKSSSIDFGDEPVMMTKIAGVKVFVSKDRYKAAKKVLADDSTIDFIILDDGLQNFKIPKSLEILVYDSKRGFGNKKLLPAGPLRESVAKLNQVDFIVANQPVDNFIKEVPELKGIKYFGMSFIGDYIYSLLKPKITKPLSDFKQKKVYAVSAIGNNRRFFEHLSSFGILVNSFSFLDHYYFQPKDFDFDNNFPIIITEKDAIKIIENTEIPDDIKSKIWVFPIKASLKSDFSKSLLNRLFRLKAL